MYTVTLSKVSVSQIAPVIYDATIRCRINDGVTDVVDTQVTIRHNSNSATLASFQGLLRDELVKVWNKFKAEKTLLDADALNTALSTVQAQANSYVNT